MSSTDAGPKMESSNAHGSEPGHRTSRSGTRGGCGRQKWSNRSNQNVFTGKTKEMNSHIFQLQVE